MSDKYLPYGRQSISESDIEAVVRVLRSDYLTTGPEIAKFEQELAEYTGARYAVAVSNGTAALHLAVLALGLPAGFMGLTSPNTFVATANAVLYAGGHVRFADINPRTYVLDPESVKEQVAAHKPDVVLPVHFAGHTAGLETVSASARQAGAYVIEDAAHSIGGRYRDGSMVGSCGYSDMTTFSFHPVKTMTTGEGGAITTNDAALYERLLDLRTHGITRDTDRLGINPGPWYYEMQMLGYNYRITDIQAALGRSQLSRLDQMVSRRREIVARYNRAFADLPWLTTPYEEPGRETAWHLYVPLFEWKALGIDRPGVMKRLRDQGIGSQVLYIPVPDQPYYRQRYPDAGQRAANARDFYEHGLALPLFPAMTDADQERVIQAVRQLTMP